MPKVEIIYNNEEMSASSGNFLGLAWGFEPEPAEPAYHYVKY